MALPLSVYINQPDLVMVVQNTTLRVLEEELTNTSKFSITVSQRELL